MPLELAHSIRRDKNESIRIVRDAHELQHLVVVIDQLERQLDRSDVDDYEFIVLESENP